MEGIRKAINNIYAGIAALLSLFTADGIKRLAQFIENRIAAAAAAIGSFAKKYGGGLPGAARELGGAIQATAPAINDAIKAPIEALVKEAYQLAVNSLEKTSKAGPDDWKDNAARAMGDAFEFGLSSFSVSALFEMLLPEKLNTLNGVGPVLATLAGFEEVTKAAFGPLFHAAIARGAQYDANRHFRNLYPAPPAAATLFARRLIDEKHIKDLFALAGLHPDYEQATIAAAFRPLRPFVLSSLGDDQEFDWNKLRDTLRFGGLREEDIDLMIQAFQARALKTFRSAARAALLANYEFGLVADQDLAGDLDAIDQATDHRTLIRMAALDRRILEITKDYLSQWDAELDAGAISLQQYETALHGLGIVEPRFSALVAKATGRVTARGFTLAAHEQQRAAQRAQTVAVAAAMTGYRNRKLDDKALTAALLAAGVAPATAALYLSLAQARGQKKAPAAPAPAAPPGAPPAR